MENNLIILNPRQRIALNKLWFIYGNDGKKHTHNNHRYIQNILEKGEDTEEFYRNGDYSQYIDLSKIQLTDECLEKVKEVLNNSL